MILTLMMHTTQIFRSEPSGAEACESFFTSMMSKHVPSTRRSYWSGPADGPSAMSSSLSWALFISVRKLTESSTYFRIGLDIT